MAILKCKMCGGDLMLDEGLSVCTCTFCGTKQTVPKIDNEKKLTLFSRANRLRAYCEFDKAYAVYENIIEEFPEEAEAYWGLVLCKFGIEYVDDEKTGKKIPTCHRSSFDSIFDDESFILATEYADVIARGVYREEAKVIEELRKGILALSTEAEKYDVFICYKEKDDKGERTIDSVIAQDVYDELCEKGLKVFFARITLEDKLGTEYEPYIFSALQSSSVMLVFGTSYDNFHSVWVKNEWSRFLKLIEQGEKKTLIPCFKDIDAYDMPSEFKHLQAQDMSKIGATQDLVRGVLKLTSSKGTSREESPTEKQEALTNIQRIKRANELLKNRIFDKSKELFDMALLYEPYNEEALVGMFLADNHCPSLTELSHSSIVFINSNSYKILRGINNSTLQAELDKCVGDSIDFLMERGQGCLIADMFSESLSHFTNALKFDGYNEKALFGAFLANQEVEKLEMLESCNGNYTEDTYYKALYPIASDETKKLLDDCVSKTVEYNTNKGYEKLSSSDYPFAKRFFDVALDMENTNEKALIGMLYADLGVSSLEQLIQNNKLPSKSHWYERVLMGCDEDYKAKIEKAERQIALALEQKERRIKKITIISLSVLIIVVAIIATIVIIVNVNHAKYLASDTYSFNVTDVENGVEIGKINALNISDDGVLVIPEYIDEKKVVGIGKEAFINRTSIKKLYIPSTVEYIEANAFSGCTRLSEIHLPNSIKTIGNYAFYNCDIVRAELSPRHLEFIPLNSLRIVTLTDADGLENAIFGDKVKTVYLPDGITNIPNNLFKNCLDLTEVVIPDGVTKIGVGSFMGCASLSKISLPDTVTHIDTSAFENCTSLNEVYLNTSVKYIGANAFSNCISLREISLPASLSHLDDNVFENCTSLSSFTLPESITTVGSNILNNCTGLHNLTVSTLLLPKIGKVEVTYLTIKGEGNIIRTGFTNVSVKNLIFDGSEKITIGENALQNHVELENVVINCPVAIKSYAFNGCTSLINIDLTNAKSIDRCGFSSCTGLKTVTIGESTSSIDFTAFDGCTRIKRFIVSQENANYQDIDGHLYSDNGKVLIKYASGNTSSDFIVPNSVTTIASLAFEQSYSLTRLIIPKGVMIIKGQAINDCINIAELHILNGDIAYGENVFYSTSNKIKTLSVPAGMLNLFTSCKIETLTITGGEIPPSCFANNTILKSLTIREGVTSIGASAFKDCSNLSYLSLPESLEIVDAYAFSYCDALKRVTTLSEKVEISSTAFHLSALYVGEGSAGAIARLPKTLIQAAVITHGDTIKNNQLGNLTNLHTVRITGNIKTIESYALAGLTKLKYLTLYEGILSIGDYAFSSCPSLESVTIPLSVVNMGDDIFKSSGYSFFKVYYDSDTIPVTWNPNWNGGASYYKPTK